MTHARIRARAEVRADDGSRLRPFARLGATVVALAQAFVRIRPQTDRREFVTEGRKAGEESGKAFADGFRRTSSSKTRGGDGFAADEQKRMRAAGGKAGAGFSEGFGKGTGGLKDIVKRNIPLAAGLFVPLGLGAAVAEIGQIGMAYEDNLNIFKSVSKATGAQMAIVADQARKLGADVTLPGVSAAGAAEAMTELAKAGFSVQQSMDAAKGTLQLARVANISEADAAEIAANAVNAFGLQAKQTTFVVDELAAAANSSSVEISDVSLAFKMAAAVFSGVQGPAIGSKEAITELNTAIAVLGNNGIKGSDAGTSLKQMLLQLTGPTQQAKDQMQFLALRAAGATASLKEQNEALHGSKSVRAEAIASIVKHNQGLQVQGDIAYDASGKMRGLRDIISLTAAGTKGLTQEEKNYAITQIFGADASRSVLALLKGGLPVYDKQRQAVLSVGAAASFAAAKNAGLRGALDNVKSQVENAAIAIYNVVKGPLTSGLNNIAGALPGIFAAAGKVFGFIGAHFGVFRDWAVAIGAVTLALKLNTAMLAVNAAGGLLAYLRGITLVTGATRIWTAAQVFLNAALFANPIGIVILAITALVAGIVLAYRHSETFRKIVDAAWRGIAAAAKWAWETVIKPAVTALVWYFQHVIAPVALWLWHNVIQPAFSGISRGIQAAWVVIQIIFKAWWLYLTKVLFPVIRFLWTYVVKPIFALIAANIAFVWNKGIKPIFQALGSFIGKYVAPAFRAGVNAVAAAWDRIRSAAAAPVRFVIDTVINKGIIGGINWVASKVGVKDRIPPVRWNSAAGSIVGGAAGAAARRIAGGDGPGIGGSDGPGTGDGVGSLLAGPGKWLSDRIGLGRVAARFGDNPFVHAIGGAVGKAKDFALTRIQTLIGELLGAGGGSVSTGGLRTGILGVLGALRGAFGNVPVISGFRPGAHTLSGALSYHALGRAIDIPPVLAWARFLNATFGGRLRELITPWQQYNIHNGQPHTYTGAVWRQHNFAGGNAHIHAAMDDGGTRVLRPGYNVIPNWTGRPEPVYGPVAARTAGGISITLVNHGVIGSQGELDTWLASSVKRLRRDRRIP